MFGTFNLRADTDLGTFKSAFDAMCEHLQQMGFVHSWRMWERVYHQGYDASFPTTSIILEVCFYNEAASQECWDYIQSRTTPIDSLHTCVTRQVTDTHFVLSRRIG